jgi:hypothetical protein
MTECSQVDPSIKSSGMQKLQQSTDSRLGLLYGFKMVKHVDYDDNFWTTPGILLTRIMVSLTGTNNLELHSVDIEQTLTQTDK